MIFYFTGTGNSGYAAENIAQYNKERLISIAEVMKEKTGDFEYSLVKDEVVGFIYPIYAWAPPKLVLDFISRLKINNYNNNYIFSIATCGANIGNAITLLQKSLAKKELILNSGFSIVMPNNYIIFGDVDSKEVEKEKLLKAEDRLKKINEIIKEKKRGIFDVNKGPLPRFLTSVINPLFNKNAVSTKKFYVTDACTGCGLCEKICSVGTISVDKKPTWGTECIQCLACIHRCPTKAIQYGKGTEKKGRYKHPSLK